MISDHSSAADLIGVLEDKGHRTTGPRREVVALVQSKVTGFTAEEICKTLPRVGRATVFRTLRLLQDVGVICKLTVPNGIPVYAISRADHHHHTVCVRCGKVGEFQDSTVERLIDELGMETSGEIVGHRIELYVTCRRCLDQLQL